MKNVISFFVAFSTFQKHFHAFHRESYYGDPYSMEYVGKFSTVNLTKEDLLWVDNVVEMLRNTSYSTIDFNASITYPSRFQHLYETGVPTISTRRFATISTKSFTKEMWTYPQNDLWSTPSSNSFAFGNIDARNSRVPKKCDFSLLLDKTDKYVGTKNIAPLWTTMSEDRLAIVRDIIRRNIIKKPVTKYTERQIFHQVRKKHTVYHTTDSTTRTRRSVPFFLDSDEGPWLTTQEQEQEWALRGTSLLDSEKYDFPFPYDFDKWPGCTTKDLTDPKNTVQILEYENGHIRFIGVSKPGWNEFPWKPTEFTTRYPAYQRLDKYLTYLSRPWYGFYSTLSPPASIKWRKRTNRMWSRYTFGNRFGKSRYNTTGSRKWIIDRWPPDWNRTIFPRSLPSTQKRTWWKGKWHLPIRIYSIKINPNTSKSYIDYLKSTTNILTLSSGTSKLTGDVDSLKSSPITLTLFPDALKPNENIKNSALNRHSTIKSIHASTKSTPGFGFLSISPTWYTYDGNLSHTFRHNASWIAEWSRLWYSASKTLWSRVRFSTSNLSYLEKWNKEFSLPLYTLGKTSQRNDWSILSKIPNTITWSKSFHMKPSQSQSKQWSGGYANQWTINELRKWDTFTRQNKSGWTLPELKRGSTKSPEWSNTWNTNKQFQQSYPNQWRVGGGVKLISKNKQMASLSSRTLYPKSYQQYPNQWNRRPFSTSVMYRTEWNQKWTLGLQQHRGARNTWPKTWPNQHEWNKQQLVTENRLWYTNPKSYVQFPPNQWERGEESNVWNKGVPPRRSKTFYANQQYPNQENKRGHPAWSRSWNTKPPQFYPKQRENVNQWNTQKPRELSSWTAQGRRKMPLSWSKLWDRGQPSTRNRTWYSSPSYSFN